MGWDGGVSQQAAFPVTPWLIRWPERTRRSLWFLKDGRVDWLKRSEWGPHLQTLVQNQAMSIICLSCLSLSAAPGTCNCVSWAPESGLLGLHSTGEATIYQPPFLYACPPHLVDLVGLSFFFSWPFKHAPRLYMKYIVFLKIEFDDCTGDGKGNLTMDTRGVMYCND